jgi:hypothetical protein
LQRFSLDVTKVNLMFKYYSWTHLPQPPACSCWAVCMLVGAEGHERQAREMRASAD